MKSLLFILCCTLFSISAIAQDKTADTTDGWKKAGTLVLNLNQGMLQNWAAGGEQNTLGVNSLINYSIKFKKQKRTWENFLDFALGFQNATSFKKFRKTDDKIDITSKYGYRLSKNWHMALLGNFNSQILEGYAYTDSSAVKISNFLTPGKILLTPGLDFRPDKSFSLFLSPIGFKWILKMDDEFYPVDAFGVPAFRRSENEIGAYISAKFNKGITKWATFDSRLDLFSNYKNKPSNVDVLFTNLLTMKFNEWLGSTVSVDILYDDNIIKRTQLKQTLGIGLVAKL